MKKEKQTVEPEQEGYQSVYVYPKRKPVRTAILVGTITGGLLLGCCLGIAAWTVLEPFQHHALYGDEAAQIEAKWEASPITVSGAFAADLESASYFESDAWNALSPVKNADGSYTFVPETKETFTAFVEAIRGEIDSLIEQFAADDSFAGFLSGEVGMDYHTVTVQTPMKQASLIDQDKASVLVRQMKIQSLFYNADQDVQVALVFVNNRDGSVVLTMNM